MKVITLVCVLFSSLFTLASAQENPGPSPTESVGCEPHGDQWHCDRPAAVQQTQAPVVATSAAENPGPSPTASVGCEPHGDQWHCDGPAAVAQTSAVMTATSAEDLGLIPTESTGCEPHGDHWHCDGPVAVATATAAETAHDHERAHEHGSVITPAVPSPTESAGCEPRGDHWHCDGPATAVAAVTSPAMTGGVAQLKGSNASNVSTSPTSSIVAFEGAADNLHLFSAVKIAGILGAVGLVAAL